VYSSGTAVFKSFEWIGTIRTARTSITSLKRAKWNGEKLHFSSVGLEAYKTLATAIQILLMLPVAVASCECSFRKMKLIKLYLQSTMSEDRFTNCAILSDENEVASSIDFSSYQRFCSH
jgi:hypothetical protein